MKTTFEMDGLLTQEDIDNRYTVVFQCKDCKKWTTHYNHVPGGTNSYIPCETCGGKNYDASSIKSFRTYNPLNDNKRKIKIK